METIHNKFTIRLLFVSTAVLLLLVSGIQAKASLFGSSSGGFGGGFGPYGGFGHHQPYYGGYGGRYHYGGGHHFHGHHHHGHYGGGFGYPHNYGYFGRGGGYF